MQKETKQATTLSPLMRVREVRKAATARLVGVISKARAREWIRHINKSRKDWN